MKKVLLSTLLILALLLTSSAMLFVNAENDDAEASAGIPEPKFFEDFEGEDAATKYCSQGQFTASVENGYLSLTMQQKAGTDRCFAYPLGGDTKLDGSNGITFAITFNTPSQVANGYFGLATNVTAENSFDTVGLNYGPAGGASAIYWIQRRPGVDVNASNRGRASLTRNEEAFDFAILTDYTVIVRLDVNSKVPTYTYYQNGVELALKSSEKLEKSVNELFDTLSGNFGIGMFINNTTVKIDSIAIYEGTDVKDGFILSKLLGTEPQLTTAQVIAKGLSAEDELELRFLVKFDEAPVDPSAVLKVVNPANNEVRETIQLETPARYKGTDLPDTYHVETDYIYLYTIRLNAKQITDKVVISYENNGFVNTEDVSYTIEEYCQACIADANKSEEIKKVCAAILFYGYHAQKAFHYNENNLPVINDTVKALCQIG